MHLIEEKSFPKFQVIVFHSCRFDKVFDQKTSQDEIFANVAQPVIDK